MKTIMWATALLALSGCAATAAERDQEKILYVGPQLVDCVGVAPMKCMQVKDSPEAQWAYFYEGIQGFTFEEGYQYKLKVAVKQRAPENIPADASSQEWHLIKILEKTNAQTGASVSLP